MRWKKFFKNNRNDSRKIANSEHLLIFEIIFTKNSIIDNFGSDVSWRLILVNSSFYN